MPSVPSFDQIYDAAKGEILARSGGRLSDFSEGSDLDAVAGGSAVLADLVLGLVVALFAATFIDTAEGDDLDTLIVDHFNLTRLAASNAVGSLQFTRGTIGVSILIPAGTTVEAEVDGATVTFTTDAPATMLAADQTIDIDATATETGRSSNVAAGAADDLLSTIPADPDLTVTNPLRFAGGAPVETDEAYRTRTREFLANLAKGTEGAIVNAAKGVAGVEFAAIDESTIGTDGFVSLFVADSEGAGNAVLVALVEPVVELVRCAGVELRTFAAIREEITQALTVTVLPNTDVEGLRTLIRDAVQAYTDNLDPNESLYGSRSESSAIGVSTRVRGAVQTDPAAEKTSPTLTTNSLRVREADLSITFVTES